MMGEVPTLRITLLKDIKIFHGSYIIAKLLLFSHKIQCKFSRNSHVNLIGWKVESTVEEHNKVYNIFYTNNKKKLFKLAPDKKNYITT